MFQFTSGGELTSGGEFDIRAQVLIFSFKVGVLFYSKFHNSPPEVNSEF